MIVFGTKDVASYASGSFDATDYTFKSSGNVKFTMSSAGQFVLASGGIDFNTPGTGTFYNPGLSDATGFNFLSNQIIAYTANTPVLHINSNGAIGINQPTPQANAKLHVQGSNNGGLRDVLTITNQNGSSGTEVGMVFECGVDEIARISAKNEGSDNYMQYWSF